MESIIAVTDGEILRSHLKQYYLLFDKIALIDYGFPAKVKMMDLNASNDIRLLKQLDWLIDNQLIIRAPNPFYDAPDEKSLYYDSLFKGDLYRLGKKLAKEHTIFGNMVLDDMFHGGQRLVKYSSSFNRLVRDLTFRISAGIMRNNMNKYALPLISTPFPTAIGESAETKRATIIEIVMKRFPVPAESTNWNDILEFKRDPDSKYAVAGLRTWISNIAKHNLSDNEIEERLEWQLATYNKHVKLHNIKCKNSFLATAVITTAEILEGISKFRLSTLARSLFSIKNIDTELLECELSAPGRELAYIERVRNRFETSV